MGAKPTYQELERKVRELTEKNIERRQVEEALRECEQRFRSLYAKAPSGYQSLDNKGCIIEIDQAWLDMFGYASSEEIIGRYFGEFLHPELQKCFKENFPRFMAVGEILGAECDMLRKDGSQISIFFNGTIIRDESGSFKHAYCVLHDITGYWHAEEEKERLDEELQKTRTEIETLRGMLPVCSRCGKNRVDQALSRKARNYIEQHAEVKLSNCLCPACKAQNPIY